MSKFEKVSYGEYVRGMNKCIWGGFNGDFVCVGDEEERGKREWEVISQLGK